MIQYCLEVSLAWSIFYLIYRLFLRKETFFKANRWYLLHTLWIGALLPYLRKIPFKWSTGSTDSLVYESVHYLQLGTQAVVDTVTVESSSIDFNIIITLIYIVGAGLATLRMLIGLSKIAKLYRYGQKESHQNYMLVTTDEFHLPFSFFNFVFLHNSFLEDDNLGEILKHELKHIHDRHTFDVLFMELFAIVFWWNPLVYLYKNEIKQNHEFIADAYASQSSTIKNYGQILLGHSSSGIELALTHQFFNSHLKKRINMLCTTKSARYKLGKYLVLIPCLLFFGILFSSNTLMSEDNTESHPMDGLAKDDVSDFNSRKLIKKDIGDLWNIIPIRNLLKLECEVCVNKSGDIVYAELRENELTDALTSEQKKKVLKTIYNGFKYEYRNSHTNEECGSLIVVRSSDDHFKSEELGDTTPIKRIVSPEVYVSEREYYLDAMTDPLIVINGEISESTQEHYFTQSKIISVTALDVKEGQKKYGNSHKNGVLEFTTQKQVSKPQNSSSNQYIVQNGQREFVYKVVDEMPRFPGCEENNLNVKDREECSEKKLLDFVYANISYPKTAKEKSIEGLVVVQFVVQPNGKVANFKIVRSIGDGCDEVTLDMLAKMSNEVTWIPGEHRGRAVPVLYTLPVKYKLNDEQIDQPHQDCKGTVVIKDGIRLDVKGKYEGKLEADSITQYSINYPERFKQYKDYCAVLELITKADKERIYKIESDESFNITSLASDCADAVVIVDGEETPATITDGKLEGDLLSDIKPDQILNITIHKKDSDKVLPPELSQYQDLCLVMIVSTNRAMEQQTIETPVSSRPLSDPADLEELQDDTGGDLEFTLYQNEPNPFDNSTIIGFVLPEAASAKLTIYDVYGKVVTTIVGDYFKGYNKIEVPQIDINTSGVLYYQLDSGTYSATKKMMAIK